MCSPRSALADELHRGPDRAPLGLGLHRGDRGCEPGAAEQLVVEARELGRELEGVAPVAVGVELEHREWPFVDACSHAPESETIPVVPEAVSRPARPVTFATAAPNAKPSGAVARTGEWEVTRARAAPASRKGTRGMFSEDLARAILADRARRANVAIEHHRLAIRPVELGDVDRLERLSHRLAPRSLLHRFFVGPDARAVAGDRVVHARRPLSQGDAGRAGRRRDRRGRRATTRRSAPRAPRPSRRSSR